jgi:hypothetical protein
MSVNETELPRLTQGERGKAVEPKREIGSRVFCASGRDEQSWQAMLGGRWQGAFTWAFTRALEQWKTAPSGPFRKSTISHVELLFRTRMLLEALSFPQHPVLVDRIGNLPVFQHDADTEEETRAEPDAERRGGQIDPSGLGYAVYTFDSPDATAGVLATIVATNTASPDGRWTAQTEYWCIPGNAFDSSKWPSTVGVTKTVHP